MSPPRLGRAESNPLFFLAGSAASRAPRTTTFLFRDPGTHRTVCTAPFCLPRSRKCEKKPDRRRAACLKNKKCILYRHVLSLDSSLNEGKLNHLCSNIQPKMSGAGFVALLSRCRLLQHPTDTPTAVHTQVSLKV